LKLREAIECVRIPVSGAPVSWSKPGKSVAGQTRQRLVDRAPVGISCITVRPAAPRHPARVGLLPDGLSQLVDQQPLLLVVVPA